MKPVILDESLKVRHPGDGMFSGNESHYEICGQDALRNIAEARRLAGQQAAPTKILDFACGFGRVGRYLRAAFPEAEITYADLQAEACAFCADAFKGINKPVDRDFNGIDAGSTFDLIWVGSLFTHLPEKNSRRLLELLYGFLAPGGVLVFTTHGQYVQDRRASGTWPYNISAEKYDQMIAECAATGYGFVSYGHDAGYGISLSTTAWWKDEIARLAGAENVMFSERGWARHQDAFAVHRGA